MYNWLIRNGLRQFYRKGAKHTTVAVYNAYRRK